MDRSRNRARTAREEAQNEPQCGVAKALCVIAVLVAVGIVATSTDRLLSISGGRLYMLAMLSGVGCLALTLALLVEHLTVTDRTAASETVRKPVPPQKIDVIRLRIHFPVGQSTAQ